MDLTFNSKQNPGNVMVYKGNDCIGTIFKIKNPPPHHPQPVSPLMKAGTYTFLRFSKEPGDQLSFINRGTYQEVKDEVIKSTEDRSMSG